MSLKSATIEPFYNYFDDTEAWWVELFIDDNLVRADSFKTYRGANWVAARFMKY